MTAQTATTVVVAIAGVLASVVGVLRARARLSTRRDRALGESLYSGGAASVAVRAVARTAAVIVVLPVSVVAGRLHKGAAEVHRDIRRRFLEELGVPHHPASTRKPEEEGSPESQ